MKSDQENSLSVCFCNLHSVEPVYIRFILQAGLLLFAREIEQGMSQ